MSVLVLFAWHGLVSSHEPSVGRFKANQCGPACLYLISRSLGQNYSLDDLSRRCNHSATNGTSLGDLEGAARQLGWHPVLVALTRTEVTYVSEPSIGFLATRNLQIGHFVVQWSDGDRLHIVDPLGFDYSIAPDPNERRTFPVMIMCTTTLNAIACHWRLVFYRSPARGLVLAASAVFAGLFTFLTLISLADWGIRRARAIARPALAILLLTMIGCGSPMESHETRDLGGPKLIATEAYHDAGTLRNQQSASHVFSFRNLSDKTVHIARVESSCSCLSARLLDSKAVLPGHEGRIKVSVVGGREGRRTVRILAKDDDKERLLELVFRYEVPPPEWSAEREVITLGEVTAHSNRTVAVGVNLDPNTQGSEAKLRVVQSSPGTAVEVNGPGRAAGGVNLLFLKVTLNTGSEEKNGREENLVLAITDRAGVDHIVRLRIAWTYHCQTRSYPSEVVLIVSHGALIGPTELRIESAYKDPITSAKVTNGPLTADVTLDRSSGPRRTYRSALRFVGDGRTQSVSKGFINYYASSHSNAFLSVPFRVSVEP